DPIFPFARAAIRLHCGRFPSIAHGLDELEHETLVALDDALDFRALFSRVTAIRPLNELGLGDVQFAAMLTDLAAGPTPLVALVDREDSFQRWRVARTPAAVDVLAGHVDPLRAPPPRPPPGRVPLRTAPRLRPRRQCRPAPWR